MSSYTKGPWFVTAGPNHELGDTILNSFSISTEGDYRGAIADLQSCGHIQGITRAECAANARLIAAAPELLAALEAFLESYIRGVNSGDWGNWNPEEEPEIIAVRAAIAKAKGEQ